jgi:hypothetical protein
MMGGGLESGDEAGRLLHGSGNLQGGGAAVPVNYGLGKLNKIVYEHEQLTTNPAGVLLSRELLRGELATRDSRGAAAP